MKSNRKALVAAATVAAFLTAGFFARPHLTQMVSASDRPAISISLDPASPIGAGVVEVTVRMSKSIDSAPPFFLVASDGGVTPIALTGDISGKTFIGMLIVDEGIAEGDARFLFSEGFAQNSRDGGKMNISGAHVRIDRTPPSAPSGVRAVFNPSK
jgi:hypothetical protein